MNRYRLRCVFSIFCLTTTFIAPLAHGEVPRGWIVAGDHPKDFEFSVDARETHQQHPSALIAARPGVISNGFGTLMQSIDAEDYRGTRLSLSGYLKTQDAGRAQLWMRVDGSDRRVLSFDNMDDRPVVGTTDWSRYQIVLDVPEDSRAIAFGFLLMQKGKAWGGNFKLEKVDAALAVTSAAPVTLAKEPTNLDFTGASVHPMSPTTAAYKPETVRVYDLYRAEPEGSFNRARIQATDAGAGQFYRADKYNLCGMHVVGTTDNDHYPVLRWDMKLSVFVRDGVRVAGIAAGTFAIQPHARTPTPRPAISRLEIKLEGERTSAVADVTTQNPDHGVAGFFPEAYTEKLFDAFDAGKPFTLNVTLDSGESESVLMQTRRGTLDPSSSYRGGGAPMKRCLTSLVAPTNDGLRQSLIELEHPW
jgi:hypothetical protein